MPSPLDQKVSTWELLVEISQQLSEFFQKYKKLCLLKTFSIKCPVVSKTLTYMPGYFSKKKIESINLDIYPR
jgi:hypothetical protein